MVYSIGFVHCLEMKAIDDAVDELHGYINKASFTKSKFRRNEEKHKNRIRNDVKDLEILTSAKVTSGYYFLYSRYIQFFTFLI